MAARRFLDARMRDLPCSRLEIDELWAFVGKKQRHILPSDDENRVGDTWTYVALCADTKIVPCFLTGKRTTHATNTFISDLASRLRNRVQISTDGLRMYVAAIGESFPGGVDCKGVRSRGR